MIHTAIEINPNLRFANGETSVEFEGSVMSGPRPSTGDRLGVYERVSRIYGVARVTAIDTEDITLLVEWDRLTRDDTELNVEMRADLALALVNRREMAAFHTALFGSAGVWVMPLSDTSTSSPHAHFERRDLDLHGQVPA